MKHKTFWVFAIILLIFILQISVASATIDLTDDLISYWKFDETSGTTAVDSHGTNNGTITGVTIGVDGKINQAFSFDGINDYVSTSFTSPTTITVSAWVYADSINSFARVLEQGTGESFNIEIRSGDNNRPRFSVYVGGSVYQARATTWLNTSTWYHLVGTYDGNEAKMYVNGVLKSTNTIMSGNMDSSTASLDIGRRNDSLSSTYWDGLIDEPAIWSRALNQTEITALYNSGDGLQYPFGTSNTTITPKVDYRTIINETLKHTINLTISTSGYDVADITATLIWNGQTYIPLSNVSVNGTDLCFDGNFSTYVRGVYATNGTGAGHVWVYEYYKVPHNLSVNISANFTGLYEMSYGNGSGYLNPTQYWDYDVNKWVDLNFNITWDNRNNNLTVTVPSSGLSGDDLQLRTRIWWQLEPIFDPMNQINKYYEGEVTFLNDSGVVSVESIPYNYTGTEGGGMIEINFPFISCEGNHTGGQSFHSCELYAPLVENNGTNKEFKWKYEITLTNTTKIQGETNNNQDIQHHYFFDWDYDSDVMEANYQTIQYTLPEMQNPAYIMYNNINWNGTDNIKHLNDNTYAITFKNPTITNTSQNFSFFGKYKINFYGTEYERESGSYNQTIWKLQITNCSIGSSAMVFNILHESSNVPLTASLIDSNFKILETGVETGFNFNDVHNFSVCVYPSWANYTVDAYIIYAVSGGYSMRYYLQNAQVTNTTTTISMYNFNHTVDESIKMVVMSEDYDYLSDVVVKLLRYYPTDSVWRTVQVDLTDEKGQTIFHIIEGSVDYRFQFEHNNSILYKTSTMKFICNVVGECDITFVIDTRKHKAYTPFIDFSWDFNNVTNIFTFEWDDTTLATDEIRLFITKNTISGRVTICDLIGTSSSGVLTCDVTGHSGSLTVNAYRKASPFQSIYHAVFVIPISQFSSIIGSQGLRQDSYLMGGILSALIVLASSLSLVGVVISTIVALLFMSFMGMFGFITFSFIISAAVIGIIIAIIVKK